MYNVFKRPMFKLGGQADQGSGIMSYVEPRQNYMFGNIVQPLTPTQQTYSDIVQQNPYTGYAIGGRIGYQKAGPVNPVTPGTLPTVKSPYPVFGREQALESMYGKESIQNAYQKEVDRYKKDILGIQGQMGILSQDPDSGVFLPGAEENMSKTEQGLAKLLSPEGKKAFETRKLEEFNKIRKQEGLTSLVPTEEAKAGGNEGDGNKNPEFDETKKTNPASKIREEADMLKGLLKDEGLTTAENALIIARALAVPGGIGAKIAAAGELAMPLIRERAKIDREAVLKAYETSKEIKISSIKLAKTIHIINGAEIRLDFLGRAFRKFICCMSMIFKFSIIFRKIKTIAKTLLLFRAYFRFCFGFCLVYFLVDCCVFYVLCCFLGVSGFGVLGFGL
jgi:hypothetical protein